MSELTKELRALGFANSATSRAADRIDKLEECLRVLLKALVDSDEDGLIEHAEPIQQARALMGEK